MVQWDDRLLDTSLSSQKNNLALKTIERFVSDITASDRQVFERVFGYKLLMNQRIVIQVIDKDESSMSGSDSMNGSPQTNPDEWAAYSDVSDEEAAKAELEAIILDWAITSDASDEEVAEVRSVLFHPSACHELDI